ncbi:hypothetical protein [uncultured Maribacter sp.]|uniref:hypothetical protein n=1 Tax=uncultured Maribacter sp. TaxID=431308 RepID=UPI0030ED8612
MGKLRKTALLGTSLFTAGLPFLCCWTPAILIGVAGFMGLSSSLEWLHPVRTYLYSISFLTLGIVHYRTYRKSQVSALERSKDTSECGCIQTNKNSTYNKWFLWTTTFLVVIMTLINYLID